MAHQTHALFCSLVSEETAYVWEASWKW